MPFLQTSALLQNLITSHANESSNHKHAPGQKSLRPYNSLANVLEHVRKPVEDFGAAVERWYEGQNKEERSGWQNEKNRKHMLYLRLQNATSYGEWQAAASDLDEIEGNNKWKSEFNSSDFDAVLVQARLRQLDEARLGCDVGRMLFLIRTSLTRGLGDMGNIKLYKYSHIGTKDLIERYISSALETIDGLLDASARAKCDGLETKYILEQILSTRQAFGRSALLLSGGATFGMNHIGVLKSLWEARLLPRIISGASAGSIVSAVFCTRTDAEIPEMLVNFCIGDLAVFDAEGNEDGILRKIVRFLKIGALFDISHLTRVMRDILGELTFQEAYNRTRKILNICVSSASLYELPRLLNYITAPNVLIWSAVAASCSVPLIFSAASLLAKDPTTGEAVPWNPSPQRWIDGSVDNDLPMTRLAELFNVNHFIVSQVNPHVVPFLVKEEESITRETRRSSVTPSSTWLHSLTHLAKGEALHRMQVMAELGICPNALTKAVSVLSQKYSGDITIFPDISYTDFPHMLSNPTTEFMLQAQLSGERATWPKLSRIRNHCAIELALDNAVHKLRARVAFSPSQVDLRLNINNLSASDGRKEPKEKFKKNQRPLSQSNTPDARTIADQYQNRNRSLSRSKPTPPHRKALSISTVLHEPPDQTTSVEAGPLDVSKHLQDLTSSGAETSIMPSSSWSSLSTSSPTESSSPVSPRSKPLTHDDLFPSVSQPNTPSMDFLGFSHNSPTSTLCHSPAPSTLSLNLYMTPKAPIATMPKPSSQEGSFKHLSVHQGSTNQQGSSEPRGRGMGGPEGMKRDWGLKIDFSGVMGRISRKKKVAQR